MFSITTMELVTSVPTDVPSASSVNILNVKPHICITQNDTTIDTGIDTATMKVERTSCRNANRIAAVRITPITMLLHASSTDALMKLPESRTHCSFMPEGSSRSRLIRSTSARTLSITRTALESPFFTIFRITPGWPS